MNKLLGRFCSWTDIRVATKARHVYPRLAYREQSTSVNPDEFLNRSLPIVTETLSSDQDALLNDTIRDFLPLRLNQFVTSRFESLLPGHHLVYFRPSPSTLDLLEDGTDDLHAPDRSWKYRVWAGGSLIFPSSTPIPLDSSRASLVETIDKVRLVGPTTHPEKVFVNIKRDVFKRSSEADASAIRGYAHKRPQPALPYPPLLVENRMLCFLRQIPASLTTPSAQKPVSPPVVSSSTPVYKVTLTATPALLFRFSALTFNAHAIHIDPQYTKEVYGLPNLLVHGPLTLVLMLEVLERAVLEHSPLFPVSKRMALQEFNYKNLGPVFVDEEMTICCSRLETRKKKDVASENGEQDDKNWPGETEEWQVWIQKKHGDGVTVAVRGVGVFHAVDN